ncbi:MAG: acyl-CoA dehydrogenase [Actinomycetia bacterium]|nr:acyl-CoA dehydrogenase [Actinomycetes bacterium]
MSDGSASTTTVQIEVRQWLADNWDEALPRKEWLGRVADSGWAAPSWPAQWHGKGLDPTLTNTVKAEFRRAGADGTGQDRTNLWANTVLAFGSDELKQQFLRPLLMGEVNMCLLYSEPGAGSDLAGIQTRAERDGDEWIVNGQKVWTSGGRQADYALLITRTDWDVPKHRGITFFWFPMKQDGVEVRALRQATGDARFNEVFITDGRVPNHNILGEQNNGWMVLQTALQYERAAMGENQRRRQTQRADSAVRSAGDEAPAPVPDLSLTDLARDVAKSGDPMIRQRLATLHSLVKVNEWNNLRAKAELAQGNSSSVVSLGKLAMSRILHTAGSLQTELLGAEGMTGGTSSPRSADATYALLNAFFTSIGGGTDQIQRNIIGERILGLPKEPELDKTVPFREVRKA